MAFWYDDRPLLRKRFAEKLDGHAVNCAKRNSSLAAVGGAALAARLVSRLLAHMGLEKFPAAMRRCGAPDLSGAVDE